MSEPILKAIMKLFALVARVDGISQQERDQIKQFLQEHIPLHSVNKNLQFFDDLVNDTQGADDAAMARFCQTLNSEIDQKQKVVVMMELISIVSADHEISSREHSLIDSIAGLLNVSRTEISLLEEFAMAEKPSDVASEHLLLIDSTRGGHGPVKHIYRDHLHGMMVVAHLPESGNYFLKYLGTSDVVFNGVPLKPNVITILGTGSSMRWGTTEPVYYGDILRQFNARSQTNRLSFEARGISYQFKNGKLGLRGVDVIEESGRLIALMGASGAGKSTLLHVLNGTEKPSQGQVLINGIDIHATPEKVEGIIGFVPQDDLLIEDLTVYQNLYFAAKLCFNHVDEKKINALVLKTLDDLGLNEIRDLTVGSPLRKTISGGQRKRLNIGLELLREPAVLFCDEPTSGLSSRDSENIIELLKELALKGKLVFAVIHQPSSDIFKMFDKLVILDTGGYQIYYGNPVDAVSYFKRNINLIDSEEGECSLCGNVNPEQIFNIIETRVINEYGNFTSQRKYSPEQWNQQYQQKTKIANVPRATEAPVSTLRIPGWLKQTHLFGLRDLMAKLSNTQYLVINLLEAPLLAFILAFIVRYYNVDDPFKSGYLLSKNLNLPAYFFMSVIVALFMGLTVSAEEIIRDRKILKREKFLHLNWSSYLASKVGILFMMSAIQTCTFVLVGNSMLEIKGLFFQHWAILFTTSCFANLLGLNISSAFNSAVTIYILIPILLIPQLILSGVVVKFDKLNPIIGNTATVPAVGDLMTSRWAFEAAMVTQFKDNAYEREFYLYDKVMAESDFKKIYYIPELETRLDFVNLNRANSDASVQQKISSDLELLRHEIANELETVGKENFAFMDRLDRNKFDSATYQGTKLFFETLKKFYINRFNKADQQKEKLIRAKTHTAAAEKEFDFFKTHYQNESISDLVKNVAETHRIIEKDGKLVQKIYPIYKDPDPDHIVDFDAQFYMPKKHFLNYNIDTLAFNLMVIWTMTIFLLALLYFEVLRRIIDGLGNLSNPIPKRM
jgi:ABC-type multidrug transport system ATPase subunit/uncharacterized tellurite resistance protein B-like protein